MQTQLSPQHLFQVLTLAIIEPVEISPGVRIQSRHLLDDQDNLDLDTAPYWFTTNDGKMGPVQDETELERLYRKYH